MSASIPGPDQTDSSGDLLALARLPAHRELGLWWVHVLAAGRSWLGLPWYPGWLEELAMGA